MSDRRDATPLRAAHADLAICEQVLEHVRDPYLAARNLACLVRHDGLVLVSTPFPLGVKRQWSSG